MRERNKTNYPNRYTFALIFAIIYAVFIPTGRNAFADLIFSYSIMIAILVSIEAFKIKD